MLSLTSGTATGGELAIFGGLVLTTILSVLADNYTTMIALQHGFVEGNPIQNWLFKKIGTSLAAFVSIVAVLFIGGFISNVSLHASYAFFGILSVAETVRALLNYRALKAKNISLK